MRLLIVGFVSALLLGCSMTSGSFSPSTNFTYPNSDVTPLGHVHVTAKEGAFLVAPVLTKEKIVKLLDDALGQKPGADMIVNYSIDTTYTIYPFYTTQEISLDGTAVKMQVGQKELKEQVAPKLQIAPKVQKSVNKK